MGKEFKYTKLNTDVLQDRVSGLVTSIHQLAREHGMARASSVYHYRFMDKDAQLLYEVLLRKLKRYAKQVNYRKQFHTWFTHWYDTPREERLLPQFKSFWKNQRLHLQRKYGQDWFARKNRSFYKGKKAFYKKVYLGQPFYKNRYGYIDYQYKYDTRGYKWKKYIVDNNNNFVRYIDE